MFYLLTLISKSPPMIARLKKLLLCSLIFFFGTSLKSQGHQIDVPNNNQLQAPSINPDDHSPGSTTENPSRASIGNITDYQTLNGEFIFTSNTDKVKVMFYTDDIFRIWLGPAGTFTDNADIVVYKQKPITTITSTNNTDYYKLESATCVLRVYKTPLRFALYRKDNATLVFEEESPLNYGTTFKDRRPGKFLRLRYAEWLFFSQRKNDENSDRLSKMG
jgi:hypothetical protein